MSKPSTMTDPGKLQGLAPSKHLAGVGISRSTCFPPVIAGANGVRAPLCFTAWRELGTGVHPVEKALDSLGLRCFSPARYNFCNYDFCFASSATWLGMWKLLTYFSGWELRRLFD